MLDLFEHGVREVVEKVFLVCFPLISLMKNQVSSLNEKGVKAVVYGQKVLTRKLRMFSKVLVHNLVFTKSVRFQVGFEYRSRI